MPWLVDAFDEYTEESNNGPPDSYLENLKQHTPQRRELIIEISEKAVRGLFDQPVIEAMAAYPLPAEPKEEENDAT